MFRFEDLRIWKEAVQLANELFDIADDLEQRRLYRFAEQLRGSGLSICNNIAEGAGCQSNPEFKRFLSYTKRSFFEIVNMLIVFSVREYVSKECVEEKKERLEKLCRMIGSFSRTLCSFLFVFLL